MTNTQRRYTDKELITLLHILASDYNRKPTQRDILGDDRLPTHHTFNKRFGSVGKALEVAGLNDLQESTLHKTIESMFRHYEIDIVSEYEHVGSIIVDFKIADRNGELHLIDIVDLDETDIEEPTASMRHMMALPHIGTAKYHSVRNIGDAVTLSLLFSGEVIIDKVVE